MGAGMQVAGPWGPRPQVYADWAASGRALGPVEDFVRARVLPAYGNTHTTTSAAGLQTSCFRLEARQAVAQARPKPFPLRPAGCPKRAPAPVALNVPRRSPPCCWPLQAVNARTHYSDSAADCVLFCGAPAALSPALTPTLFTPFVTVPPHSTPPQKS